MAKTTRKAPAKKATAKKATGKKVTATKKQAPPQKKVAAKKTAVKRATAKKPAGVSNRGRGSRAPLEERTRLIAEAAYYRAERRGFQGGSPEQDWFEAEAEINRLLGV